MPALYSVESSAIKWKSGMRRILMRLFTSCLMKPFALFSHFAASYAFSIPSSELMYTLQWDRSLESSTLMIVRIELPLGSFT